MRLLRAHPGPWHVFLARPGGGADLIATLPARPTYADLGALLAATPGAASGMGLLERAKREFEFNRDSLG